MTIAITRRNIALAASSALASVAIGISSGSAPSTAEAPTPMDRITAIDAATRAQDAASSELAVFDHGTNQVIHVDKARSDAELREASLAPNYRDARGNPRYVLVWRDGHLVPGPRLACTPSAAVGEPATCTVQG